MGLGDNTGGANHKSTSRSSDSSPTQQWGGEGDNQRRLFTVESWWPVARDIAAFLLGSSILVWQTVVESEAQAVLVTAATALLGLPIVGQVQRSVSKRQNGGAE